jgi:hypothetical protein
LPTFTFRVRDGESVDIPGITIQAANETIAFRRALKYVKHLERPGWILYCTETGTSLLVEQLARGYAPGKAPHA